MMDNRYEEALEKAKELYLKSKDTTARNVLEEIFPQLKESSDEKIRKELIDFFKKGAENGEQTNGIYDKDILAWLEKQGKQQKPVPKFKVGDTMRTLQEAADNIISGLPVVISIDKEYYHCTNELIAIKDQDDYEFPPMNKIQTHTDKVELEFKAGDWIVNNISKDVFLIKSINSGYCTLEDINGNIISPCLPPIESESHLWTLRDAKEGDVLSNDNHILILKELVYDWSSNGTPYSVKAYCGIKPDGNFEICKDNWCFCGTLHIHPATKEQCNTLKKAMADAGYIFDFDKKELKKIDQKSYGQRKECLYCQFNHAGECKGSCQMKINEQIHIDKIESKFKVGNWYQCTKDFFGKGVTFDKGTAYYCAKEGCLLDGCHIAIVKDLYNNFKQWTIDDAKKGDVLVDKYGNIGIYQGDKNAVTWDSYCYCGVNKGFYGKGSHEFPCYPASEEQRDLLFQKMKEAGYEFDFDKEELKKIEDEPNKCEGCNNVKGCIACVDGSEWARIEGNERKLGESISISNVVKAHLRVKLGADLNAYKDSIIAELNYVMRDLKSYDELTDKEKEIWTREAFNELFDF